MTAHAVPPVRSFSVRASLLQRAAGHDARERADDLAGCVNKLTDRPVCIGYTGRMRTQLSDDAWASLAKSLDVEEAALKAVAAVEAAGCRLPAR